MPGDRLTPAMQLIISEGLLNAPSPTALTKQLSRGLLKDLYNQALHTIESWPYEDHTDRLPTGVLRATLGPARDPFSSQGKCMELPCRVSTAERFSRSVALYVDHAIVSDPITSVFFGEYKTVRGLSEALYPNLAVLKTMLPLIESADYSFCGGSSRGVPALQARRGAADRSGHRTRTAISY